MGTYQRVHGQPATLVASVWDFGHWPPAEYRLGQHGQCRCCLHRRVQCAWAHWAACGIIFSSASSAPIPCGGHAMTSIQAVKHAHLLISYKSGSYSTNSTVLFPPDQVWKSIGGLMLYRSAALHVRPVGPLLPLWPPCRAMVCVLPIVGHESALPAC